MAGNPIIRAFFDEPTNTVSYLVADPATRPRRRDRPGARLRPQVGRGRHALGRERSSQAADGARLAIDGRWRPTPTPTTCPARPTSRRRPGRRSASASTSRTCSASSGRCSTPPISRPTAAISTICSRTASTSRSASSSVEVLTRPAIRPADITYKIGDAVFVGDTLFMPDYGTARADFPGGDAHQLYRSIRRLLGAAAARRGCSCATTTRRPAAITYAWETTVRAERDGNVHVQRRHRARTEFVAMRDGARRDARGADAAAAVDPGEHPRRPLSAGRAERRELSEDSGAVQVARRRGLRSAGEPDGGSGC